MPGRCDLRPMHIPADVTPRRGRHIVATTSTDAISIRRGEPSMPEGSGMPLECSIGRVDYPEPLAVYRMRMPAAGGGGSSVFMAIVLL